VDSKFGPARTLLSLFSPVSPFLAARTLAKEDDDATSSETAAAAEALRRRASSPVLHADVDSDLEIEHSRAALMFASAPPAPLKEVARIPTDKHPLLSGSLEDLRL
jgi:hypothetical protein